MKPFQNGRNNFKKGSTLNFISDMQHNVFNDNEENLEDNFYLTPDEKEMLAEIFEILKNEDGELNTAELKAGLKWMKYDREMPRVYDLVDKLPEYGDFIEKEDFLRALSELVGHKHTEEGREKLFATCCDKGEEIMQKEDVEKMVKHSGDRLSKLEVEEMINQFSNHKDHIDLNDFQVLMSRKFIGYD